MEEILIRPSRGWSGFGLKEVWGYRELLYFLTWRDVKVRYKQTIFGASWAVIQPFMLMVVFSVFFGNVVKTQSSLDVPYPIWSYAGLVPWALFSQSLTFSSQSLVSGANLVSKVYFPRLIMPIAATGSYLLDFVIAMGVLILMMLFYGVVPTTALLWLPAFTLLGLMTALGVGITLSALNAKYRDVQYVLPFLVQLWLLTSPVIYPSDSEFVPTFIRPFFGLNPMAGVVEGFRWALLGETAPATVITVVSAIAALVLFVGSILYFNKVERTFADVI